jgi:putative SOS response-associated peptidase YedK
MCGRFNLTIPDFEQLARLLGVDPDPQLSAQYRPRYNVPPSDQHWIVTPKGDHTRALLPARWGLGEKKLPLIRGSQNLFRGSFGGRRCVIPTTGFFEWEGEKGARKPHWFHPADPNALVLLGAVYGESENGFNFAIITTAANDTVAKVHDRMPVVVPSNELDRWLRGDAGTAAELIKPAPEKLLVDTEVSQRLNSARNDDAACLEAAVQLASPDEHAAPKKKGHVKQQKMF